MVNTQTHAPSSLIFHYIHLHHAESMSTHSFTLTNIITCRYTLSYNKAEHTPQPYTIHTPTHTHNQQLTHSYCDFVWWYRFRFFFLVVLFFFLLPCISLNSVHSTGRPARWFARVVFVHNDECWFMHSLRVHRVIVIIKDSSSIRLMQKPHMHHHSLSTHSVYIIHTYISLASVRTMW